MLPEHPEGGCHIRTLSRRTHSNLSRLETRWSRVKRRSWRKLSKRDLRHLLLLAIPTQNTVSIHSIVTNTVPSHVVEVEIWK